MRKKILDMLLKPHTWTETQLIEAPTSLEELLLSCQVWRGWKQVPQPLFRYEHLSTDQQGDALDDFLSVTCLIDKEVLQQAVWGMDHR